jgi:rubrerythrin
MQDSSHFPLENPDGSVPLPEAFIRLEVLLGRLYRLYAGIDERDRAFWETLSREEARHAALLRRHRDSKALPPRLFAADARVLEEENRALEERVNSFSFNPPSREAALHKALFMERAAGEIHYQQSLEESADGAAPGVFEELNRGDRDHAERIRRYIRENGISSAWRE